jgi:antitoxin component YwqK of YwqJK toxin-antitoxin module
MKNIFTLLFGLLCLSGLAQEPQNCTGTKDNNGKPNGSWNCTYPGGKKQNDVNYKSGVLNGVRKEYFEDGVTLRLEVTYQDGELNGVAKEYYSNSQLKYQGTYNKGVPKGVHREYGEDGKQTLEYDFK